MGGRGSGRWYRWDAKRTVEECPFIDVNAWRRAGQLWPGHWFRVGWTYRGRDAGGIRVRTLTNAVELHYTVQQGTAPAAEMCERVGLAWTACRYGGQRPWLVCPGTACGRRVTKLYGAGGVFRCRHCHHLTYASRREPPHERALARAQDIRMRLGGSGSIEAPFPAKPKGMHWRTYRRLRAASEAARRASWGLAAAWFRARGEWPEDGA